jgi:hypothetical protein
MANPVWQNAMVHIRAWLCDQYSRTSIPVLVIGVLTLVVASANYWMQRTAYNRPELAASKGTMRLDLNPKHAELHCGDPLEAEFVATQPRQLTLDASRPRPCSPHPVQVSSRRLSPTSRR